MLQVERVKEVGAANPGRHFEYRNQYQFPVAGEGVLDIFFCQTKATVTQPHGDLWIESLNGQ